MREEEKREAEKEREREREIGNMQPESKRPEDKNHVFFMCSILMGR